VADGRRWQVCEGCRTAFSVRTCDPHDTCPVRGCSGGPWRILLAVEVRFLCRLEPWALSPADYRRLLADRIKPEPPTWVV
jgi:hypothetical protein